MKKPRKAGFFRGANDDRSSGVRCLATRNESHTHQTETEKQQGGGGGLRNVAAAAAGAAAAATATAAGRLQGDVLGRKATIRAGCQVVVIHLYTCGERRKKPIRCVGDRYIKNPLIC